ncbi:MAG: His Kinase A (phospho-acceptor) domain protein, partial [uncultured archaeon A07HB70]
VAATALPAVFYVLSLETIGLLTLHYEPVGVAVFAVGTLYVVDEQFVAVPQFWRNQLVDSLDEKIVLIDDEGRVRDYNRRAVEAFPELADGEDQPLDAVVPRLAEALGDDDVLTTGGREHDAGPRYLQVVSTPLTRTGAVVGRAVVCTDVTRVERQRRQLERQSDQLDDFADAITHELRNALAVARGHFDVIAADRPPADTESARTSVDAVRDAHRRIDRIVTDLARLAAREQTVESVEECSLDAVVEAASADIGADDVEIQVERDATVVASRPVLTELFTNVVQFAEFEDAERVTVETGRSEIVITVDGQQVPENRIEALFAYGEAVPSAETGTVFPTIRAIGSSHGWTVEVDPRYRDGIQVDIGDVRIGEHGLSA